MPDQQQTQQLFDDISINNDITDSSCGIIPSTDIDSMNLSDQKKERYKQDTRHRHILSCWVMFVVSIWLFLVMTLLFLNGPENLGLNDGVMITLLGTTTINILGLPLIILKSLFKS